MNETPDETASTETPPTTEHRVNGAAPPEAIAQSEAAAVNETADASPGYSLPVGSELPPPIYKSPEEVREDRLVAMEKQLALVSHEHEITKGLIMRLNQNQNALNQRINGLDLTRPVLEVTVCANEPPSEGDQVPIVMVALCDHTHPTKPNSVDVLRKYPGEKEGDPPRWIPADMSESLTQYLHSVFRQMQATPGEWKWVRIRQLQRPAGYPHDFGAGEDDTIVAEEAVPGVDVVGVAANDTAETSNDGSVASGETQDGSSDINTTEFAAATEATQASPETMQ